MIGVLIGVAVTVTTVQSTGSSMSAVGIEELQELRSADTAVVLLDVRTPWEYESETGFLPGARHIPLQELQQRLHELEPFRQRKIVVYCRTQNRSAVAARFLKGQGFDAVYMVGGIVGWNRRSLEVEHAGQR